jgi:outer membrane receptor protein involved in Fe transport
VLLKKFASYIVGAIAIFTVSESLAQPVDSIITGIVSDVSGSPIPGISVLIEGTNQGDATDGNGVFKIVLSERSTINLEVSGLGYHTKIVKVDFEGKNSMDVPIKLKEKITEMNELLIEGESEATSIKKLGFEVEAIETKAIQSQSIELNTILDQTPGIQVRQQGGFGSRADYMVNGLGGKAIRFFMDGVPMDYFGSSFSVNMFPISLVQRVDIYKGVVPVDLGSDALGGAINLVTNQSRYNSAEISYSYGSFNTHRASLQGNLRAKNSGATLRILAFYNYSNNDYEVWGDDIFIPRRISNVSGSVIKISSPHTS